MNKKSKKLVGAFSAILVVAAIILAGYFMINKQAQKRAEKKILPTTEVGKILAKDLDTKYPETPTEVVKMYWRITSCIYNKSMSDADFDKVLTQNRKLYDDEFLNDSNNSFEKMKNRLKKDIKKRDDNKENFSAYIVQKNDTVKVSEVDGKEYATIISSLLIKQKGGTSKVYENFMCRRDADGKWKILGWEQTTPDVAGEVGVE